MILGGGPAGLGAAYRLRLERRATVTVVERQSVVGGNAGSFSAYGQRLDYGSHRLHHSCDRRILADIRRVVGGGLVQRRRNGRIRLRGRWIRFPLRPTDLLLRMDRGFALSAARDMVRPGRSGASEPSAESFASALEAGLGSTVCREFYFPYVRKIWGLEPEELSPQLASRRVSANSFAKLIGKVLGRRGAYFHYPAEGFGAISEGYARMSQELGAEVLLGWTARRVRQPSASSGWTVEIERGGERREIAADYVWSTVPITVAARLLHPMAPHTVLEAAASIRFRGMVLVYLVLPVGRFTSYDAHYFPQDNLRVSRLSEPKNYSGSLKPEGRTVLCAELPCDPDGELWKLDEQELGALVLGDLGRAGLEVPTDPESIFVRRLRQAYPVYHSGYEEPFTVIDEWLSSQSGFLSYGRQGLFAHDNTHHALYMAYAAADCLENGAFDEARWQAYRDVFSSHVVED